MTPQEVADAIEGATGRMCAVMEDMGSDAPSVYVSRGSYEVIVDCGDYPPEVVFDHEGSRGEHYCPWADTSPGEIRDFLNSGNRPARATWRLREDGE